jgi:hypothetical protein
VALRRHLSRCQIRRLGIIERSEQYFEPGSPLQSCWDGADCGSFRCEQLFPIQHCIFCRAAIALLLRKDNGFVKLPKGMAGWIRAQVFAFPAPAFLPEKTWMSMSPNKALDAGVYLIRIFTVAFVPMISERSISSSSLILTGINWITFVYVPEVVKLVNPPVSLAEVTVLTSST